MIQQVYCIYLIERTAIYDNDSDNSGDNAPKYESDDDQVPSSKDWHSCIFIKKIDFLTSFCEYNDIPSKETLENTNKNINDLEQFSLLINYSINYLKTQVNTTSLELVPLEFNDAIDFDKDVQEILKHARKLLEKYNTDEEKALILKEINKYIGE